ncbi:SprB repeat-containing protein, partial [Ferruginibacter sp. HRS2-29]|uniref:SprB repeat-containing protein n=1 Tax=Ferruginibacter sp. HRS2-29 TaxID=2487334 RepID=UPI0020CBD111
MRRILLFVLLAIAFFTSHSQNLSYTCPRDTVLGCGINCFDLSVTIPDLRGVGDNYIVGNVSQQEKCYPLVPPGGPGPSSNIIDDDRYSPVIPLPFPFRFYGITYNSLLIGANGNVTFDISLAGANAHYDDLGDLPNTQYDPAMIMGPYHDLDIRTASTGKQIKYETFGSAPNRKFIVSFYRIALFDCDALNRNTSQIILHESTGVIETTIIDQEICTGWINGKAMVGLQDMTRTKGITAPNRKMSDPAWGSVGMNETWRFTPVGGPHLYQSMQLLDGSGTVVATGDTSRINANNLGWTFTNVCPPNNGPSIYVVKTTYQKLDDPAQTYFSLDTIRVTRNAFPVSATATNTTCGASVGTITASQTGGTAPYTYSLNAGPGQASNVFPNMGAGTYTVTVVDATGCRNTATVTVGTTSSLTGTVTSQNVSCPGNSDGTITVTPTSGTAPYSYSANGGPSQASNIFTGLPPG